MDGGSGMGRISAAAKRLSAPRSLKATNVVAGGVTLKWTAPRGAKPKHYLILRDGKRLGRTTRTTYTDTKVKAGTTYRYTVRALDGRNRAGALSSSVRVKVPKAVALGAPAPTTNASPPIATVTPTPPAGAPPAASPPATPTASPTATPTATPTETADPDAAARPAHRGDGRPALLARRLRPDAGAAGRVDGPASTPSSSTGS